VAFSLKRRLTAIVIGIFLASWLLSAVATTLAARVVVYREIDRVLASILLAAESVSHAMSGDLSPLRKVYVKDMVPVDYADGAANGTPDRPARVRLHQRLYEGGLGVPSVNIWLNDVQILVGDETPGFPAPRDDTRQGEATHVTIDGNVWRIMYRRSNFDRSWIAAGIQSKKAQIDGSQLLLQMLLPLTLVIPLTGLALYYGITQGLYPLRRLTLDIERRREQAALEPLPLQGVPLELAPVVNSLNHLLERLAETLENEKRFTANAAHELQTPLAAISTEVQLCHRLLTDPENRRMVDRIRVRVERASHSVRQMLILARLDPQHRLATEPLMLSELILEVASELGHIASERQLELDLAFDEAAPVNVNRETVLILLRNLLSNAFRYTPAAGTVRVSLVKGLLTVANNSAHIADTERLTHRFFRGSSDTGTGGGPGAGLGLSIVKRICELHGIALVLEYDEGDRRFTVSLDLS
jgi:signal transduction histidine kinase